MPQFYFLKISFNIILPSKLRSSRLFLSSSFPYRNGLDDPAIESRWVRDFPHPSIPTGPPSCLYNGYQVPCPGVKRPGCGVDHAPPPSAGVKERVELCLYSRSGPSWKVIQRTYFFLTKSSVHFASDVHLRLAPVLLSYRNETGTQRKIFVRSRISLFTLYKKYFNDSCASVRDLILCTICGPWIKHRNVYTMFGEDRSVGCNTHRQLSTLLCLKKFSVRGKNNKRITLPTGPARRQHQHRDCIYSQHTDGLHENCSNKIILAHFIVNRTTLMF